MSEKGNGGEPGKREWVSFWSLVGMQSANAFNDNFAKFILIPLGVALTAQGKAFVGFEYVLGALLVLPFILFAPTAGWVGDRFSKSRVIQWSSWFQMVALGVMVGALWFGVRYGEEFSGWALGGVMVAFFLLTTQSAILSPAKMGVVKELVGSGRLGFGNGVMAGTVVLAILAGQVIGGVWFDLWGLQRGLELWMAALVPVMWILIGGVISLGLAYAVQRTAAQSAEKYSWRLATRHFRDLGELVRHRGMLRCALGVSFFWGFGGFVQYLLLQRAQETRGAMEGLGTENALLWVPVVVGMAAGSGLASWVCRRGNELGLSVVGGMGMTVGMFLMGVAPFGEGWVNFYLGLTGMGAACFLVPLNTHLQDQAKDAQRGLVVSATNLLVNLAGIAALASQFSLKALGVPVWGQFLMMSVVCGAATGYVLKLLPRDFVRLVGLGFFRSIYRVRVLGVERVPREGGVLLLANHVSYIDAVILTSACPRPLRFVMVADCFERKWVGKAARFFETIPISRKQAREGIRAVVEALKEGSVVCLFPEGQLTRTGGLSELMRGYEMMARRGGGRILPVYLDGMWGSIWSFAEGRFLGKWPRTLRYGVTVGFGEALELGGDLGAELRRVSAVTVQAREREFLAKRNREPQVMGEVPAGWAEMKEWAWGEDERGRGMRVNALQLGQVHLASRKSRILVEWVAGDEVSGILGILWPLSLGARVGLVENEGEILGRVSAEGIEVVALRGVVGRGDLVRALVGRGVLVLSFDEVGESDGEFFGCWVREGRVVSFARPHPDYATETELDQRGWKEGTRGKLLPGWEAEKFGKLDGEGFLKKD